MAGLEVGKRRHVFVYGGFLVAVAAIAFVMLEGHLRLRLSVGAVIVALQVLALWRLGRRFPRSALSLWVVTAVLISWVWGRLAWNAVDTMPLVTLLLGAAIGATLGVTYLWVRDTWGQSTG